MIVKSDMKKFLVLVVTAILFSLSLSAQDTDTAWTRQTLGEDILDVKFSPDGSKIATAHNSGWVRLWSSISGEVIKSLPTTSGYANAVAFSNDGKFLYIGTEGKGMLKYDLTTFQIIQTYFNDTPTANSIFNISISNDNTKLFIAGNVIDSGKHSTVFVVDEVSGKIINTLDSSREQMKLIFSSDNKYLATFKNYNNPIDQSIHYQLTLWDALTYQKIKTLDDTKTEIVDIAFSSDGNSLFETQGNPYPSKIWSLPNGDLIKNISPKQFRGINKLIYFKSSNNTFTSYKTFDLKPKFGIYDIEKDNLEFSYNIIMSVPKSMEISNDQTKIVCGMGDLIYLFNNKILGVVEQNPIQKTDSDIIIPNPLTNQALIKFNLPSSGITTLNMLNESGIKIKSLFNSYLDAGNNEVSVNITNIPSGNYFVSIQCTNYSKTLKLSIIK
jgi:WD40 repeat protein